MAYTAPHAARKSFSTWLEIVNLKSVSSILVVCAALSFPIPALGQSAISNYVAQLEHQGYSEIVIARTLLGRTKISASRDGVTREIVVARNGQILFDYRDASNREVSTSPTPPNYDDDDDTVGPVRPTKPDQTTKIEAGATERTDLRLNH